MAVTSKNPSLPVLKWLVWTSDHTGDYVRAHKVLEGKEYVSFIWEGVEMDIEVKRYKIKEIVDYKLVE